MIYILYQILLEKKLRRWTKNLALAIGKFNGRVNIEDLSMEGNIKINFI
jgi:hypothetical protein